jgi:uncharacterized repeat protein (TIGR01451 family)
MNNPSPIKRLNWLFLLLFLGWGASAVHGQVGISGIMATYDNVTHTNDDYSTPGGGSGAFPAGTTYDIKFDVGTQNNLYLTGFEIAGEAFNFVLLADVINLARVDNSVVTGKHQIVLYEQESVSGTNVFMKPGYAETMEDSLRSPIVNRGADNVFCNAGDGNGNNNNIQRIDYVFPDGFPVFNNIDQRGFLIMDRGGNDRFKIAAITGLDTNGMPATFMNPISVLDSDWGDSGITIDTMVMRGYTEGGDMQHPSANVGVQDLTGVFISWQTLGLQTNDYIYGYSLAANDVTTNGAYWTEVANTNYFPTNTTSGSSAGGLDLISGGMMFFEDELNVTMGDIVWDDWNGNGLQDAGEPGLSNVLVEVYDSHTNQAAVSRTDTNGLWLAEGIGPGQFFAKFYLPPGGYEFSPQHVGTNPAIDSDADPVTGLTDLITMISNETNLNIDAGMHLIPSDLRLSKSVLPTDVKKDDTVVYTLGITNVGLEAVALTQVTDVLPPAVAFGSYGATTGTYSDATGIWDIGNLAVGASGTLTITGTVNSGYGGLTITNTADITRMDRPDTNEVDNTASATFTIQQTDLAVLKSVLPTSASEGDPVDFTIQLTNNGPNDATGIELTDLLPSGLSYDSSVPSQGSYVSGTGIWTVGGVTNGGSASLVITATTLAGSGGTTITNTVDITASSHDDPVVTNNTASAELIVLGTDLGIGKRVDPSAAAEGQTVHYTIAVTNLGPSDTTGVTASEPLMTGVTYASNTVSQGSYVSGTGVWTIGALNVNDVVTLEIWATVDPGTVGTSLTNTATITATDIPDPNSANDTNSAVLQVSSIQLDKTSDVTVSVEPGGTITYTMIITNYGAMTHTNVSLTDAVPDGTTYVPGSVTVTRYPESPPVPTTTVYDASTTFTAPAGVTSVTVSAWGGGGGGGRETGRRATGGGGAGGAYAILANYAVTPLANYTVTVAAGGAGGSVADINGSQGGASWFDAVGVVYAEGGAGGLGSAVNNGNGAGGTGSSASSIGDTVVRGGNGAQGNTGASGAGGGGAGSTGAGGDASVGVGGTGTALYGGDGADGVGNDSDGAAGSTFGGGGSGGNAANRDDHDGGDGAAGRVTVAYDIPSQAPGTVGDPPSLATGWELVPGQAMEVTFEVLVDDPLALMAITNTASATSEIQVVPLTDTVIDPLIPVDLGVGKVADAAWVSETDAVRFSIAVTNFSALITATGVELTDLLPAGFNYVSNTASQGSYVSGTGVWTVGALNPLATASLDLYATAAVGSGGIIWTNIVDVSALDQTDLNPTNDTAEAVVGVYGSDLAVIKTVNNSAPNEGESILYSIVVTNNGPSDTTGVTVSEPLTNGVTYVSNAVSQGSYASGSGIWTVGALDMGDSATLWIAVTVDLGTKGDSITNWSRITASDLPDPIATNDQDSAVVFVSALVVTKVSDVTGYAVPGSNITYTMVVSNSGVSTHSNLVVTDWLPTGTVYVADSLSVTGPNWTTANTLDEFNAQAYTNNDGTMDWNDDWQENDPAGTAGPVGDYVGVTTGGGQLFMHWAYVGDEWASRGADLSGFASAVLRYDWETVNLDGSQTVSVLVSTNGAAPFVEVATYNGTSSGSEEIDITSFISTNTTVRFENLSVNWDSGDYGYLDNVEMEALSLTTNTVVGGGPPTLATNRTLQSGEFLTLTFDVTVENPCGVTQIVNTVSATSDLTPTNVTATVKDPVAYTDLALTKTASVTNVQEGDSVTYTIVVTNQGPVTATGLQVTEPLTNGLTYVSDVPSQGSYDDATGIWTIGSLAVGSTVNLTLTVDVDVGTAGTSITNLSRVTAMDQADPTPGDNEDTAVITVEGVDVGVGKSVLPAIPVEKEQLVYTVSVTNFGPDTATGVVVTDALPIGLTYISDVPSQGTYDDGTGLWTVGTLTLSQVETLSITALVQTNTSGTTITNTATRTATDQVDTNALNDTASVEVTPTQAPLDIFKTASPTGTVGATDTISYTIVVTNISVAQTQTGVDVTDTLPANVTYVADSISVSAPVTTNETILDQFNARNYGNNDGTTNWSANWVESEGDGPTAGDTQILFDTVRGSTFTLRFAGASRTMAREADLDGKISATLSFDYRRDGLEAGEYVAVEVSSNGTAGTFTEVGRFNGAATDAAYTNFSYDIGAWISTSTAVRFISPAGQDVTDILWVDDVQIEAGRRVSGSVPGSAPPNLVSGLTLLPGEAATLTFDVTVDSPATVTQLVNSASVTSDQMTTPRTDTAVNPVDIDWASVGGLLWFDVNADGIRQPTETNRFADVPIDLMDTNDIVVASLVSDASGEYLFTNVFPETYYVRFDLRTVSTNVGVVTPHVGTNSALNSDVTSGDTGSYGLTDDLVLAASESLTTINLGLARKGSTRAEIGEVWGEWRDGTGHVVWRTSSEWGTAGFFVVRIDPETGEETRLNTQLIPSAFQESGARYEWVDPLVLEGDTGHYRLEEVELAGTVLDLGTHEVLFTEPLPVVKTARAVAEPEVLALPARAMVKSMRQSSALKVTFRKEGLYGVSLQGIATGMGRSLEEIEAWLVDDGLSFRSQFQPIPILLDADRSQLVFYGQPAENWYTRDTAILITHDKGLAMSRRDPGSAEGETEFPVQVRIEEDRYPFDSATTLPEDFYYWDYVISGHATLGLKDFAIDLTGYAGGDVELTVRLMGWSNTEWDPDHLAEFLFNGAVAGSVAFDGQDQLEAELIIPAAQIIDGVNTLSVKGVLQEGHTHSYFVVDRIDASFTRNLTPLADCTALFRAGPASDVSAAAFVEPLAMALDESGVPTWIADENGELPTKTWAITVENERFAVVEADAVPLLTPEPAAADAWFLSPDNRIDYLVITSRDLAAAAQELADYRTDQGLRVGVATFEDICDLMTGGLRTPEAIPELLAYAQATWAEAPWMVVLAGNGHYDYLSALNNEVNHVPPMLLQTHDGIFAADGLLADTDGDELPDIAIGRLPAITVADLEAMIAKIKAFESRFGREWQNMFILASDVADLAGDFMGANDALESLAGEDYPVDRIDLDATGITPAHNKLMSYYQSGAGFIHYTGHGGLNNLSSQGLLKGTDVASMNNPTRPPITVALSCLVGRFEAPGINSLGELLMRKTDGGSVAVWGPSGLSRNAPAVELGEAFYRAVMQESSGALGLAILQAYNGLQVDIFSRDTVAIYNLLGDPALRIASNTGGHPSDNNFAQWRWQHFNPEELTNSSISGLTQENFFDYAMDGGYLVEAEMPEFGYPVPEDLGDEPGFILRWKRRINRKDIDYKLLLSSDLESWEADSSDLETLSSQPDPDGVMETVRTKVKRGDAQRTFVGVKAKKK